jgi:glucose-1-phosphate thymidylyltransferase
MPCRGIVVVPPGGPACPTDEGPSGAQRIANRPIVCHALDALVAAGITELCVVAAPASLEEVRKCIDDDAALPDSPIYLTYSGPDLVGALEAAAPFAGDEPAVVHFADGLIGQELEPFIDLVENDPPDVLLLLHRSAEKRARLGPATQRLLGISELNGHKSRLELAGVCLFGPGAVRRACAVAREADGELDLSAIAERLAGEGRALQAGFVQTWRRYSGDPLDLLELNRIVLDHQVPEGGLFHGEDNRIEGRVIIHPTAEVRSSVILGPTIIGAGARIFSSYIGPYTSIGAGAEIESAEIERSIIADGARIMHVPGRIEASTVGRRASIFRDFALPRAMRLHVGEGVELALN